MVETCQYCNKTLTSKCNLIRHQKTKKCLSIQDQLSQGNKQIKAEYQCKYCNKILSTKERLKTHDDICINKYKNLLEDSENKLDISNKKIIELEKELYSSKAQTECAKDFITTLHELNTIAVNEKTTTIVEQNEIISGMMKKYMKKQPRKQIDSKNVVYILTTPSLKKERRYILGKAKNLTSRLSTYNKTDEHEIIFYQECIEEEIMNMLEPLIFKKLDKYREQANRERFILPENKDIDFFINTIKNCFEFVSS